MADAPEQKFDELVERLTTGFGALLELAEDLATKTASWDRSLDLQKQYQEDSLHEISIRQNINPSKNDGNSPPPLAKVGKESQRGVELDHLGIAGDDHDTVPSWMRTLGNDQRVIDVVRAIPTWRKLRIQQGGDTHHLGTSAQEVASVPESSIIKPVETATQPPCDRELNFTTEGKQGDLKCPFATRVPAQKLADTMAMPHSLGYQRRFSLPTPPHPNQQFLIDPIAAELQATDFVSPPPSANGSASKCPIRFLDQHSPEEIAKYFENHKHEIPRSHEICVKRYQSNSESIRQLDAKYGNLVNMIQGLGVKHQPLLPTKEEEDDTRSLNERHSFEKVERWAATYSNNFAAAPAESSSDDEIGEGRTGHFDRPLKEIRVGESPSRPWGITVPFSLSNRQIQNIESEEAELEPRIGPQPSASMLPQPQHQSSGSDAVPPRGKYPFDPQSSQASPKSRERPMSSKSRSTKGKDPSLPTLQTESRSSHNQPKMVFTGPVFIGYSAEQARDLMRECFQNMNLTKD
ncbi:MAG: hypothetical protein Q9187_000110 [Circinaria calcarea]